MRFFVVLWPLRWCSVPPGRKERAKTIEEGLRNRINLFAVI